ncbi:MAG: hypothetical protein KJN89_00310 [Gammaproteobacteria bacterium]|nr:hypothetical protein [Gammaproteobacteria bacterium]NNJ48783.1 hypothetical protein [Gammaproteobacteria bacterium]
MKSLYINSAVSIALCACASLSQAETQKVKDQENKNDMLLRVQTLEQRIQEMETTQNKEQAATLSATRPLSATRQVSNNGFNPAISVILDGVYASYKNDPEEYQIPGYALGGEAELAPEGFSLGHSEITMSNNIDDKFFGQFTLAIAEHEGEVEVELEEAFFETLSLGHGFTIRGGRFYSALGYLNQQHPHAWDFQDAPLVYRGIFGNQYFDDGLRASYVTPTDVFLELGTEVFSGKKYPAGGEHSGAGSLTGFVNVGGDIGTSHSWQAGVSYWAADSIEREYGGHDHDGAAEVPLFEGDSNIAGANLIYKWAPNGNYREQNLKFQFEYFTRDDDGQLTLLDSDPLEESTLSSKQSGYYAQIRWKFLREWATAVRYDRLDSDNAGSDSDVLDEAGLVSAGHEPVRASIMAEWIPSEFSRIRVQYNRDESYQVTDDQIYVQYTFSIGAHGAHAY